MRPDTAEKVTNFLAKTMAAFIKQGMDKAREKHVPDLPPDYDVGTKFRQEQGVGLWVTTRVFKDGLEVSDTVLIPAEVIVKGGSMLPQLGDLAVKLILAFTRKYEMRRKAAARGT